MPPSPTHKTNYAIEALSLLTSRHQKPRPGSLVTGSAAIAMAPWTLSASGTSHAFVPTDLSGLTVWLRADLGFTPSSWADQSGNGNNATQATGGRQPTTRTGINSRTTVFFDASVSGSEKGFVLANSLASLSASHAFAINKRNNAVPSTGVKSGFWQLGSSGAVSNIPYTDGNIYDDGGSNSRATAGAPVVAFSTANVYEVQDQAGSFAILMNGQAQFSRGTNTVALSTSPAIGCDTSQTVFFDGDWGEFILYNRILSSAERSRVISYLNSLWALGAV